MYLPPLGASTLEQVSICPAILFHKVNWFIAGSANKVNLSMLEARECLTVFNRKWKLLPLSGQSILAKVCRLPKNRAFYAFSIRTASIARTISSDFLYRAYRNEAGQTDPRRCRSTGPRHFQNHQPAPRKPVFYRVKSFIIGLLGVSR